VPEPIYPYVFNELFVIVLLMGFATILGFVTDYFWRSHSWNTAKSFEVIVLVTVIVAASYSVMYYNWQVYQLPGPVFEVLDLTRAEGFRYLYNFTIVVSYYCRGTTLVNVTNVSVIHVSITEFWNTAKVNGTYFKSFTIPSGAKGIITISFPDVGLRKAFKTGENVTIDITSEAGGKYSTWAEMP